MYCRVLKPHILHIRLSLVTVTFTDHCVVCMLSVDETENEGKTKNKKTLFNEK